MEKSGSTSHGSRWMDWTSTLESHSLTSLTDIEIYPVPCHCHENLRSLRSNCQLDNDRKAGKIVNIFTAYIYSHLLMLDLQVAL